MTSWIQRPIKLAARPRGFHLVTDEILRQVPELQAFSVGIVHVFIQHTSASLTINENASPEVRHDFEQYFNRAVPEKAPYYRHTLEGPDDMPAHLKASVLGAGLSIPLAEGRLLLGTWQGLYLCEHRDHGGPRRVVVTICGETKAVRFSNR